MDTPFKNNLNEYVIAIKNKLNELNSINMDISTEIIYLNKFEKNIKNKLNSAKINNIYNLIEKNDTTLLYDNIDLLDIESKFNKNILDNYVSKNKTINNIISDINKLVEQIKNEKAENEKIYNNLETKIKNLLIYNNTLNKSTQIIKKKYNYNIKYIKEDKQITKNILYLDETINYTTTKIMPIKILKKEEIFSSYNSILKELEIIENKNKMCNEIFKVLSEQINSKYNEIKNKNDEIKINIENKKNIDILDNEINNIKQKYRNKYIKYNPVIADNIIILSNNQNDIIDIMTSINKLSDNELYVQYHDVIKNLKNIDTIINDSYIIISEINSIIDEHIKYKKYLSHKEYCSIM